MAQELGLMASLVWRGYYSVKNYYRACVQLGRRTGDDICLRILASGVQEVYLQI